MPDNKKEKNGYFIILLYSLLYPLLHLRDALLHVHSGFQDTWFTGCVALGQEICLFVACVLWWPVYVCVCICGLDGILPRFLRASVPRSEEISLTDPASASAQQEATLPSSSASTQDQEVATSNSASAPGQGSASSTSAPGQGAASSASAAGQGAASSASAPGQGAASSASAAGQGAASSASAPGQGAASSASAAGQGAASSASAPGQGAARSASAPGQGAASSASAPGQGAARSASAPGQGAASSASAAGQGAASSTSAPGQGAASSASAAGQGAASSTSAPGQGAASSASAAGQGAASSASAPGQGAARSASAPGQGAASSASAPGQGAARSASAPGQGAASSASAPGQGAARSASAAGQGAASSASAAGQGAASSASAPGQGAATPPLSSDAPDDETDYVFTDKQNLSAARVHVIDVRGTTTSGDNSQCDIITTPLIRKLVDENHGSVVHQSFTGPYSMQGFLQDEGSTGYEASIKEINNYLQTHKPKKVIYLGYSRGCLRLRKIAHENRGIDFYALMLDATVGGLPVQSDSALELKSEYPFNVRYLVNGVADLKFLGFNSHFFDFEWTCNRRIFEVALPTDHLLIAKPQDPLLAEIIAMLFNQMISFLKYREDDQAIIMPTTYNVKLKGQSREIIVSDASMLKIAENIALLHQNRPTARQYCDYTQNDPQAVSMLYELHYNKSLNKAPSLGYPPAARVIDNLKQRLELYKKTGNQDLDEFAVVLMLTVHTHVLPSLLYGRGWKDDLHGGSESDQPHKERALLINEMRERLVWLDSPDRNQWTDDQLEWRNMVTAAICTSMNQSTRLLSFRALDARSLKDHQHSTPEINQLLRFLFKRSCEQTDDPCHPHLNAARIKLAASVVGTTATTIWETSSEIYKYVTTNPEIRTAVSEIVNRCNLLGRNTLVVVNDGALWNGIWGTLNRTLQQASTNTLVIAQSSNKDAAESHRPMPTGSAQDDAAESHRPMPTGSAQDDVKMPALNVLSSLPLTFFAGSSPGASNPMQNHPKSGG